MRENKRRGRGEGERREGGGKGEGEGERCTMMAAERVWALLRPIIPQSRVPPSDRGQLVDQ